jgi:hypothetical protein
LIVLFDHYIVQTLAILLPEVVSVDGAAAVLAPGPSNENQQSNNHSNTNEQI